MTGAIEYTAGGASGETRSERVAAFHALHHGLDSLLLPNAWDLTSAWIHR